MKPPQSFQHLKRQLTVYVRGVVNQVNLSSAPFMCNGKHERLKYTNLHMPAASNRFYASVAHGHVSLIHRTD